MNNLEKESKTLTTVPRPNPLKILKNISCFKKILKGFRTTDMETILDVLMYQPKLVHSCMTKGFTIEDSDFFNLSCKVYYNIPLQSTAWFGKEKGFTLETTNNGSLSGFNIKRQELQVFLENLEEIPIKIFPINIEMRQTIDNIESIFTYKVNN